MDYEQYVINNYSIPSSSLASGDFVYFYSDGEYSIESDTGFVEHNATLEDLMNYGSNYYNRFLVEGHTNIVSFAYCFSNTDLLFCNTNRLEYAVYGSSNATGTLHGYKYVEGDDLDDLTTIDNYYNPSGANPFSDWQDEGSLYGSYNVSLTNQKPYAVFDYFNCKYDYGVSPYYVVRGENLTYYTYANEIILNSAPNNYYFSYGAPLLQRYNDGVERGYFDGYTAGNVQGWENGYQAGINANGGGVDTQTATAFSYIGQAFNGVSELMSIEVLPNITLGLCFSIPLVFTLIITIFRLVRK